jgi:hypothetical protein
VSARRGIYVAPDRFGEVDDPRARARLLDDGLERLQRYWNGDFLPLPVDRIPVWVGATWPNRRPLRRAARFDGLVPVGLPGPDALAELAAEVATLKPGGGAFDLVVTNPPGADPTPWEAAGATWCLTGFGPQPSRAEVEAAITG